MQKKIKIEITLVDGKAAFYGTHDVIEGRVSLSFEQDAVVDDLSVTLEGRTSLRVEKYSTVSTKGGYIFGDHRFLRMPLPIPTAILPKNCLARRGESYVIPFNFTVAENLLPYVCSHKTVKDGSVRTSHLLLPPSLGNFKRHDVLVDSLGPKRVKVSYCIHVRVRKHLGNGSPVLLEKAMLVLIIPGRREEPSVFIKQDDPYYRLIQEKTVYKGTPGIGKSVGRLMAETAQSSSLELPHPYTDAQDPPMSTAAVSLRFYPTSEGESPPELRSITSKLRSLTFFGALPYEMIPRPGDCYENSPEHTYYVDTTRLASCKMGAVVWMRHEPAKMTAKRELQDGPFSSEFPHTSDISSRSNSDEESDLPFFTTSLQIPIRLPQGTSKGTKQKYFVPTFSSCLVSRSYALEISLSYKSGSAASESTTKVIPGSSSVPRRFTPWSHLNLRIPLNLSVAAGPLSQSLAPPYSPCADVWRPHSDEDQRRRTGETTQSNVVLSDPGTETIDRTEGHKLVLGQAAEERPPAYVPECSAVGIRVA